MFLRIGAPRAISQVVLVFSGNNYWDTALGNIQRTWCFAAPLPLAAGLLLLYQLA